MKLPKDLKYTEDHEWLRIDGDAAYIGITDFAQNELGDIVYIEIEAEKVSKGDVLGTVEAVKTVSDLFAPVSGKILEVNEELGSNPELVNSDPYGKGWIVKISIDKAEEIKSLLSAEEYEKAVSSKQSQ